MRYKLSLFLILFFILFSNLHAQKKINYKASWSDKRPSFPDELIMVDKVEFEHEDMKMYCDSAIFNEKENRFTAFGNIYINQKDTLKIWGDELYYDGQTKVAELIGKKIKMKDKNLILETDYLVLERLLNTVRYTNKAIIYDDKSILKSIKGTYFLDNKDVIFTDKVEIYSDSTEIYSDTMAYNSNTKIASFYGPTNIINQDSTYIYTERGWYNTKSSTSFSSKQGQLINNSRLIQADTFEYSSTTKLGYGLRNIYIEDSLNNLIITGNSLYIDNNEFNPYTYITQIPLVRYFEDQDTLYLHCDTLLVKYDTSMNMKSLHSFNRVKFYRSDIQGFSDIIDYSFSDSTLYMLGSPVIWNEDNQILADTIKMVIKNKIHSFDAYNNSFVIQLADTINLDKFNQIKGKTMKGYFEDNKLYMIDIDGNAESVYFIYEDSKEENELMGVNIGKGSGMRVYFEEKKIKKITTFNNPEFFADDIDNISQEKRLLKGFNNRFYQRPLMPKDIFILK